MNSNVSVLWGEAEGALRNADDTPSVSLFGLAAPPEAESRALRAAQMNQHSVSSESSILESA